MCIRFMIALGFVLGFSLPAAGAPTPRKRPKGMSGHGEKPRPGDSRFPGDQPRPTGGLLARLPAGLTLEKERIDVRCRYGGGGCRVEHHFELRSRGPARRYLLHLLTGTLAVSVKVDGRRASLADPPTAGTEGRTRRWSSSGRGVKPGATRTFKIPGRLRHRPLQHRWVWLNAPAAGTVKVSLISHSVGGFDRLSRPRTQAEVAFALNRRKDPFTYHHELRLVDPEARARPGGAAGRIPLRIDVPRGMAVGADVALRCRKQGKRRLCTGTVAKDRPWLHWAVAKRYNWPVGVFVSLGASFTRHRKEAWLRAGISVMLRRRLDLLTLTGETDASTRFGLALVYQLFLPYNPNNMEMGVHAQLGVVLDVMPEVRPAIRIGGAFHLSFLRINALADIYPGEFKDGGGPAWRILVGAGIGL